MVSSLIADNDVTTGVGVDDTAHFTDIKSEGGIFERLLHLTSREGTEIPTVSIRSAVRFRFRLDHECVEKFLSRFSFQGFQNIFQLSVCLFSGSIRRGCDDE